MERIGAECEWWWPLRNIVVASQKPVTTKWDDGGRLHSTTGASVEYADGYSLYSYHGIRIPSEWVKHPESLTAEIALTWENMEQRRAACELLGWERILSELEYQVIDRDENPQIGELVEVNLPDVGRERFLRVLCGTGREFALCVTRFGYLTARECNAATYGWTPDQSIEHFIPVTRT